MNPVDNKSSHPNAIIAAYLTEHTTEYRLLSELRQRGWNNPEGDLFFQRQRQNADEADSHTAMYFFRMMKNIGQEMQSCTKALRIRNTYQPRILDLCFAPGGFLATALHLNPTASAMGFSLPPSQGGHRVLLPSSPNPNVQLKFLDLTMLAEDMGATEIPAGHPDAERFLPRQFADEQTFDLVLCDGQVLRTHERAPYRERREAARLSMSQLALGLEHIYPGGTMVVLLHKVEAWDTVKLLYQFSQFSSVRLFKPRKSHSKRSSFYMIARNIQREHPEAIRAIAQWKKLWNAATFGTDQMYLEALNEDGLDPATLLEEFGPRLVKLGRKVWEIQATALKEASFTQGSSGTYTS